MSRFRRVIHSIASGYFVLVATVLSSLATVPLAAYYLTKETFALWALMSSITGYLALVDLGMSGSVSRLLIDYKDRRADGVYGSLIKTGWLVLIVQGGLIGLVGYAFAPTLADMLQIPGTVRHEFVSLVRWQSALLGVNFVARIFGHLLTAHQRMDLTNYSNVVCIILSYAVLWILFSLGHGVFSWIWAGFFSMALNTAFMLPACFRLKLFPTAGEWGRARWIYFREMFGYGKDLFLVSVGTQLIVASQTMIITRTLGLEAAGAWSVGTKMFNLLSQLIWKIFDMSGPALAEMYVRGEAALLQKRYKAIVILSASFSAFVAAVYVLCNSSFVTLWLHGKFFWPTHHDLLLALWMIVLAVLHCHNCFVLITKQAGFMRYIFFVEGIVFVAAALFFAQRGGLPAIIGCSIACSVTFSGAYGVWRVSNHFRLPLKEVALTWLLPMFKVLGVMLPLALVVGWSLKSASPELQLVIGALICAPVGFFVFLRLGISATFQTELLARAPKRINPLLRRVFAGATP